MEVEKEERPNIRIEIQNEKMEVDQSENEDGEIVEEEPPIQVQPNSRTVFTTGINIFDHEEQKKLQERAKRFALKPEETYSFTDADLEELRESLGIIEENENLVRLDTVHLLGTKDMLIEDILDYFAKYAPIEVEFVDEQSVNIKWLDNVTAARAMFYSSKAVKDMPVREQVLVKDFLDTDQLEEKGQSILLKNRQVEFQVEDVIKQSKKMLKNAVDIDQITIPIPPGYWRLGDKHPKAKCLLLRYAFKTDKKPFQVESLAKYYKKLGNIKVQNEKQKDCGIFERNKDLPRGKNPWGNLAKNWDQDVKFREATPTSGETVEIKNPNLATRLGVKAPSESENEVEIVEEQTTVKKPKGRVMRMRMYADEEEERLKMKKALQKLKTSTEKLIEEPRDLRTILSLNNNVPEPPIEINDLEDLGSKLKNRSRQMVFSLERDISDINQQRERKENIKSDIRVMLNRKRGARSPHGARHVEERSRRYRDRSPIRRYLSPVRRRSPLRRRRTPERTVRYRRYSKYRSHSGQSEDETLFKGTKPRSKVAVVIKKQKKPVVASTIWSKVQENESAESSSDSEGDSSKSEESESSSSSDSSEETGSESESSESSEEQTRQVHRPGFGNYNSRIDQRNHLKITMSNDRYSRR